MKTYIGVPGTPPAVTRMGDGDPVQLTPQEGRPAFAWGKPPAGQPWEVGLALAGAGSLALSILVDYTGDPVRAQKYYGRFSQRTTKTWTHGQPWTMTTDQIEEVMAAVAANDPAILKERMTAAAAPSPVVSEGGIGPGGVPFSRITER